MAVVGERDPQPMPGLIEGRIVHYVLPNGPSEGQHRAAIVVRVWGDHLPGDSVVDLTVFTDGLNDGTHELLRPAPYTPYSETPRPGTWHWIERA